MATKSAHQYLRRLCSRLLKPDNQFMETANLFFYLKLGIIFWKEFLKLLKFVGMVIGVILAIKTLQHGLLPTIGVMVMLHVLSALTDTRIHLYPKLVREFLNVVNAPFCAAFTAAALGLPYLLMNNWIWCTVANFVMVVLAYIYSSKSRADAANRSEHDHDNLPGV